MKITEFINLRAAIKSAVGVKKTPWSDGEKYTAPNGDWFGYEAAGYLEYIHVAHTGKEYVMRIDAAGSPVEVEELHTADAGFTPSPYEGKSDDELAAAITSMQKELKRRKDEKAQEAIDQFLAAWNYLKSFPDVRLGINVPGNHFHNRVADVNIRPLPIK